MNEESHHAIQVAEQHRYGRLETWIQGALWHAETTDYFSTWTGSGETETEALAALAQNVLDELDNWGPRGDA